MAKKILMKRNAAGEAAVDDAAELRRIMKLTDDTASKVSVSYEVRRMAQTRVLELRDQLAHATGKTKDDATLWIMQRHPDLARLAMGRCEGDDRAEVVVEGEAE